jgi:hypothetical protein
MEDLDKGSEYIKVKKREINSEKIDFINPEIIEVDLSKLDNVLTCACSADDHNPY